MAFISVHLATENNVPVIETEVKLNTSISSYEETSRTIFRLLIVYSRMC